MPKPGFSVKMGFWLILLFNKSVSLAFVYTLSMFLGHTNL